MLKQTKTLGERIEKYKRDNWIRFNGNTIEVICLKLHLWYYSISIIRDVMEYAKENGMHKSNNEVLSFVLITPEILKKGIREEFDKNLQFTNYTLGQQNGSSPKWVEAMKMVGTVPPRYFMAVVLTDHKPENNEKGSSNEDANSGRNSRNSTKSKRREQEDVQARSSDIDGVQSDPVQPLSS